MQIMIKPASVSFQGDAVFAKFLHNYRMSNYLCPLFSLIFPSHFFLFCLFFNKQKKNHLHKVFIMTIYILNSKKFYLVLMYLDVMFCTLAGCL